MTRMRQIAAMGLLAWLGTAATADVVLLADGRVLRGEVREESADGQTTVIVRTATGDVRVPKADVRRVAADPRALLDEYTARRGALGATDAAGLVALGQWCRAAGLDLEATGAFEAALAVAPDEPEARAALGHVRFRDRWMSEGEAMVAKGFVRYGGKWMLPAEADYFRKRDEAAGRAPGAPADATLIAAIAAAAPGAEEKLAALAPADRQAALQAGLIHKDAAVRLAAARRLAACRDVRVVRMLTRTAVTDADAEVRGAAMSALHTIRFDRAPLYFGSGLRAKSEEFRIRSAQALGTFGDNPLAPRVLADRYMEGWGGGPRVNIFLGTSLAYIRDFEVEVAQTAAIADPIVGVIREGTSLDFQVLGMQRMVSGPEAAAIRRSMVELVGQDLGEAPEKWIEYLNAQAPAKK